MKHHTSKLFAALLACAASTGAVAQSAAPSFKINVTGTIAPGSCTPSSGDLTFDMKSINPKSLNTDALTPLKGLTNKIKITCTADTSIALNIASATKSPQAYAANMEHSLENIKATPEYLYDLVDTANGNKRVGVYGMQFRNFTYTGGGTGSVVTKAVIISSGDKKTWAANTNLTDWYMGQLKNNGSSYVSFSDAATSTTPVLASVYEGDLVLAPQILPKKDLTITGDLKFEGGATITLNYL